MPSVKRNNVLVMQSGGCTPVLNASLAGVVLEIQKAKGFGEIHGAAHGLRGLLAGDLYDLRKQPEHIWKAVEKLPAAILGTARRRLHPDDVGTALEVLARFEVGYLFVIGGNDSAHTAHQLGIASGNQLVTVLIPKTIDNDLAFTDHSPGYGSAARFVALATQGAGLDAEAMGADAPITIIEVMGRNAGWLAGAAALAKRDERDAPHIICLPEVPLVEDELLARIEDAYRRWGFVVAVVPENARSMEGPLGGNAEPFYVDDFGHPYFEGPARGLAKIIGNRLKVRARFEKPGTIQRSVVMSRVDVEEAFRAGQMAVRYSIEGRTDIMVALVRESEHPYRCSTKPVPLADIPGKEKLLPAGYIDAKNWSVTEDFLKYARPLVGRLPRTIRLRR